MATKTAAPRKAAKKTVKAAKPPTKEAPAARVRRERAQPTAVKATRRKATKATAPEVVVEATTEEATETLVEAAEDAIAASKEARGLKRTGRKAAPAPRKATEPKAPSPRRGRSYVIVDEGQAIEWVKEGKTYIEMSRLHEELHGKWVAPATFSLLRQRHDLPARHVRNHASVPWPLAYAYKHGRVATLLRSWERLQRGMAVSQPRQKLLMSWLRTNGLAQFTEDGFVLPPAENPGVRVVDYDHENGFTYVKRRKSDDVQSIIRKPSKARIEELRAALPE